MCVCEMGNAMSPLETSNGNSVGPLELLYSTVEQLLDSVQGAVHVDVVADFIDSVRWTEPFILLLISMQVVLFALVYTTRRHNVVQFIILSVLTAISLAAEKLNRFGRTHWRSFASQNYFDYAGLFLLIFVCGPFIIAANFIVVSVNNISPSLLILSQFSHSESCQLTVTLLVYIFVVSLILSSFSPDKHGIEIVKNLFSEESTRSNCSISYLINIIFFNTIITTTATSKLRPKAKRILSMDD